jgi:hypothetical protein
MATLAQAKANPFMQLSPLDNPDDVLEKVKRWHAIYRETLVGLGCKHPESIMPPEPKTHMEAMSVAMVINPQVTMAIMQQYPPKKDGAGEGEQGQPGLQNVPAQPAGGLVQPDTQGQTGGNGQGRSTPIGVGGEAVPGTPNPTGMETL